MCTTLTPTTNLVIHVYTHNLRWEVLQHILSQLQNFQLGEPAQKQKQGDTEKCLYTVGVYVVCV